MQEQFDEEIRFQPTSGRIMGCLAIVVALAVVVLAIADSEAVPAPLFTGAILFGVLAWASMLWPGLSVTPDHLVLRTMTEHQRLPLAAIESVAVGQVLAVRVGEKRYVSTAISKPWRKAMVAGRRGKGQKQDPEGSTAAGEVPYADYVENEIRARMDQAREVTGVGLLSDEQLALAAGVRRRPAWVPIVLLAGSALAFVASILL